MRPRSIQVVAIAASAALLAASSRFAPAINEGRRQLNMLGIANPKESAPPEYVFAIQALGAFRGLVTNLAFIRAEKYKSAGRYYDARDLASWICTLQPRFPSVWEFQAWNMAWNISVTTYTPEERWNWVYNGVRLLRDQGIFYNPRAVNLYRQIAWIFVNKMSESVDEHHMTFKRNWAYRMHLVLGAPPDPLGDYRPDETFDALEGVIGEDPLADAARAEFERRRAAKGLDPASAPVVSDDQRISLPEYEVTKKAFYDAMMKIAEAPATLDALYAYAPETREMVRGLRELGVKITDDALDEDEYWHDAGLAFTFFRRYRMLVDSPSLLGQVVKAPAQDADRPVRAAIDKLLGVSAQQPAGATLVRFLQRKVLQEVYKLDAGKLAELTRIFGPMDFRLVDAHSLYWVNEGLIAGEETISTFTNDKVNTARLIFFSLRNLFHRNKLTFEPYTDDINYAYINFSSDLNFIEPMHQAYLNYGQVLDPNPEPTGVGFTFRSGHINFLQESIRLLYFAKREREAAHYYRYLRENYSQRPDGSIDPQYGKTLKEFVTDSFIESESYDSWRETRSAITVMLMNAYAELADGNVAQFRTSWSFARRIHKAYAEQRRDFTTDKMKFPPFPDMQIDTLKVSLGYPPIDPSVTLRKARLWRNLPLPLRQSVYDDLLPQFEKECELVSFELARTFPEPDDMAGYRERVGARGPEKKADEVDTPAQTLE